MSATQQSRRAVPHGAWPSPITPDTLTASTTALGEPGTDGATRYWVEARAADAGRRRLVRQTGDGAPEPVTPEELNVRCAVHEYGGGSWAARDGVVVVSSYPDNRLWRVDGGEARPITPDHPAWRYADLLLDPARGRIFAVREDHTLEDAEPVTTLVALDLEGPNEDGGGVLLSGSDFVSSPTLSADGSQLAWLAWDHPNMPWDGTELWKADIHSDGHLTRLRHVAGGPSESIFQPRWAANGDLVFVSDRSGWWNLYRAYPGRDDITALCPMEAEFGRAQWGFGMSTWDFAPDGSIVCTWTQDATWHVGRLPAEGGELQEYDTPYTLFDAVRVQPETGQAIMLAGSPTEPGRLIALDIDTGAIETLRVSMELDLPAGSLSRPEAVSWPTPDGATAHGIFYPPASAEVTGPDGERPPLIVKSHGGPTSMATADLNLAVQFWTSRGFAWLDVNYGGSTGYGRAYRERLNGNWGIVDVRDCIAGAQWLAEQGRVDGTRMAIKGSSAGGYTTLAALAFHDVFQSGVSAYGVADLEALAQDTHKFESRYLDTLVGPYPEAKALYEERSPIHHVERLNCAMLLFQGLDDRVVPPAQSERMAEAVRSNGMPVALLMFEGEGHGFRREETIHRVLEAEWSFHSQVFGFPHPEGIPPLQIENMVPPR